MAIAKVTLWHTLENTKLVGQCLRKILNGYDEYKTVLFDLEQNKELKECWYEIDERGMSLLVYVIRESGVGWKCMPKVAQEFFVSFLTRQLVENCAVVSPFPRPGLFTQRRN